MFDKKKIKILGNAKIKDVKKKFHSYSKEQLKWKIEMKGLWHGAKLI